MDEASARKFVEGLRLPGNRPVLLIVELEIVQTPTSLGPASADYRIHYVNFSAVLKKVTVLGAESHQPIGVLLP